MNLFLPRNSLSKFFSPAEGLSNFFSSKRPFQIFFPGEGKIFFEFLRPPPEIINGHPLTLHSSVTLSNDILLNSVMLLPRV